MTHLATALRRYYVKKDRHIFFVGNISFQEIAMRMWQELGYTKIDPSVLSRVLSGKRVFTPQQLLILCNVLNLKHVEMEYLFHCLTLDHWEREGVSIKQVFLPTQGIVELLEAYIQEAAIVKKRDVVVNSILKFINHVERYQSVV